MCLCDMLKKLFGTEQPEVGKPLKIGKYHVTVLEAVAEGAPRVICPRSWGKWGGRRFRCVVFGL
jgi:hypothetical protein